MKSLKQQSSPHRLWDTFIPNYSYAAGDVFKTAGTPSWGYWKVTQSGISNYTVPVGNKEGTIVTSGTMKCTLTRIGSGEGGTHPISVWKSGNTYKVDDHVFYNDVIYRCIKENSDTAFTRVNWKVVGGYGNAEIPEWTSGATYSAGNVVWHDSKLKMCNIGNSDTTFDDSKWSEISMKFSFFEYNQNGNLTIRRDLVYDEFFELNANGNIVMKI